MVKHFKKNHANCFHKCQNLPKSIEHSIQCKRLFLRSFVYNKPVIINYYMNDTEFSETGIKRSTCIN